MERKDVTLRRNETGKIEERKTKKKYWNSCLEFWDVLGLGVLGFLGINGPRGVRTLEALYA